MEPQTNNEIRSSDLLHHLIPQGSPLSCAQDAGFFRKYTDICQAVLAGEQIVALDQMTGLLLEEKELYSTENFLQIYLYLAALENQTSAFIFGKIKLAQFYIQQNRTEECGILLSELEEMGVEENNELKELREIVKKHSQKIVPESCHQLSSQHPFQERSELMAQYSELVARGICCIGSWLKQNGYNRIVYCCKPVQLYGMGFQFGTLDKLVISELLQSDGVETVGLITRTMTTLGNLPILSIPEVNADKAIDAVLVAEPEIYADALKLLGNRVIFLRKVIADIYFCQVTMHPMLEVLKNLQQKGNRVLFFSTPCAEDVEHPSEWERFIVEKKIIGGDFRQWGSQQTFSMSGMKKKYHSIADFYDSLASNATVAQGFVVKKNYYFEKLTVNGNDVQSRYVSGTPKDFDYTIHMFGNSAVAGIGLEERDSSPSKLQALLNHSGIAARVLNLGADGQNALNLAYRIADSRINPDDIVVVVIAQRADINDVLRPLFGRNGIPFCAGIDFFHRPHDMGEVFFNAHHLNWNGNQKVAELIYHALFSDAEEKISRNQDVINSYTPLDVPLSIQEEYYDPIAQSKEFRTYINELSIMHKNDLSSIGAIVMNCNPFTHGHQYLIETCAKEVEWLYVFVVEEDKSVFKFSDRIEMVRQGAEHIPNVQVLPSGKFMISSLTFPEYFRKDDLKEISVDPSADVELFGKYITPALHITVRFAGDEPLDPVTAQYNDAMARMLPKFGVTFKTVRRLEVNNEPISASRVREAIRSGNLDGIKSIVPATTYKYIKSNLAQLHSDLASQG